MNSERFTISSLTEGKSAVVQITPLTGVAPGASRGQPSGGIGIAIESIDSLPDSADYRDHEFYRSNFTAAELDYCLAQPSVKTAFGEIWAAKRAVIRSGAAKAPDAGLASVEIQHDDSGKPTYPGCWLSTDHADATAVAACFWSDPAAAGAATAGLANLAKAASRPVGFGMRVLAALAFLTMLFVFGAGFWMILGQVFGTK